MITKLIGLMILLQCFLYKNTDFGLSFQLGYTVSPDRLVFIIILVFAIWKLTCGELQFPVLGKVECYMLLFAVICTVSYFVMGRVENTLFFLFDFNYNPLAIFFIAKSIPHSRKKLESVSFAFLAVGAYLAINGAFEHFGLHALVWPKYILDPHVGIQFGRTRGSFGSSEALGMALIVTFLFYALYATRVESIKRYWAYLMMLVTAGVIYTTNQRAAWVGFGFCLVVLAIAKTKMKQGARVLIGLALLSFLLGVGTHFSLWGPTLLSKRQNTIHYREVNNLTTLAMGMANPIFGVGYGNFKSEWVKYFQKIDGSGISDLTDGNHNTFLGIFAEVGLVGLIPYVIIFYYMFRIVVRVYANGEEFERYFSLLCLLVMGAYLLGANFSDYRHGPFFNTTLFLIFGCVAAMDLERTRRSIAIHLPVQAFK